MQPQAHGTLPHILFLSGAARKSTGGTGETEGGGSLRSGDEAGATETGAEESENGAANQSAETEGVDRERGSREVGEAGGNAADEGIERRKAGGTSVAVKIQQVPVDEVRLHWLLERERCSGFLMFGKTRCTRS